MRGGGWWVGIGREGESEGKGYSGGTGGQEENGDRGVAGGVGWGGGVDRVPPTRVFSSELKTLFQDLDLGLLKRAKTQTGRRGRWKDWRRL